MGRCTQSSHFRLRGAEEIPIQGSLCYDSAKYGLTRKSLILKNWSAAASRFRWAWRNTPDRFSNILIEFPTKKYHAISASPASGESGGLDNDKLTPKNGLPSISSILCIPLKRRSRVFLIKYYYDTGRSIYIPIHIKETAVEISPNITYPQAHIQKQYYHWVERGIVTCPLNLIKRNGQLDTIKSMLFILASMFLAPSQYIFLPMIHTGKRPMGHDPADNTPEYVADIESIVTVNSTNQNCIRYSLIYIGNFLRNSS